MKKADLKLPDAPLKRNDRGMGVDNLQTILKYILKYKKEPDKAYFGTFTEEKVKALQEKLGVRITGIYDDMTRTKLREVLHGNID